MEASDAISVSGHGSVSGSTRHLARFSRRLCSGNPTRLNRVLPQPYYARLAKRPEVGIVGDEALRRIIPDVAILRPRDPPVAAAGKGGLAVMEEPRIASSPSIWMRIPDEQLRHHFVEIRDAVRGHSLVTLIEIASPTNKRHGPDRQSYEAKRQEVVDSDTSLIEIDLLRGGQPLVGGPLVIEAAGCLEPQPDYLVVVNRAWQRGAELQYQLFPIRLEESLPCILVPFAQGRGGTAAGPAVRFPAGV